MKRKVVSGMILTLLLIGMLTLAFNVQPVKASGTITINADGSIDPPTANITSVDNVTYTFTDNNYDEIVVERDDIVVDGDGYTVQGTVAPFSKGISLFGRSNVTIKNMEIKAFEFGIVLQHSSNNSISGNNITNNDYGIRLFGYSNYNSISGNNITNNTFAATLEESSNNILRGNSLANNYYSLQVWGSNLPDFVNDVDASNTVDGKPVYYWISKRDMAVPLDAGYVALVTCTRITVQNLNLTKNGQGLLLAYTTSSTITKNNITNNYQGIELKKHSSNNNISGNNITNNTFAGISLEESSNNSISGNNIANNWDGIELFEYSNYNSISGNNIANNWDGIELFSSSNSISGNNITNNSYWGIFLRARARNNKFYHNNFIDNTQQVYIEPYGYANFWDDGFPSGGNYWSDYTDVDEKNGPGQDLPGSDGIWDHPYEIDANNNDNYALVEPWTPLPRTIGELKTKIDELGSKGQIDNQGIVKSLLAKLNVAQKLVNKGKIDEAKTILTDDFVPQVQNLSGIHITTEAADILIESAEYIMSHL